MRMEKKLLQGFNTYGDHVLGGLELPEGDVDGDTTLTLSLELIEHPSYAKRHVTSEEETDDIVTTVAHHT